jgi:DNA-directed RNA polymerase subunit H (RpoH/RPB5)
MKKIKEKSELLLSKYLVHINEYKPRTWKETCDLVDNYIFENKKLPSHSDNDPKIRSLYNWIATQKKNYKNNLYIMKDNIEIRLDWYNLTQKYEKLLYSIRSNEEIWKEQFDLVENYIFENQKLPPRRDKDPTISSLHNWIFTQRRNYRNNLQIMKDNKEIRLDWYNLTQKYEKLFGIEGSKEEIWRSNFLDVEKYIENNDKLPSSSDKDPVIKALGIWINEQKQHFRSERYIVYTNIEIRAAYVSFVEKNENLFCSKGSDEEIWRFNLLGVENYIGNNDKLPSSSNKDPVIKALGVWLCDQKRHLKNEKSTVYNNKEIRGIFVSFAEKNKYLYEKCKNNNEEIWRSNLLGVENYIGNNDKLPSENDKDPVIKVLGIWLRKQQQSFKNEKGTVYNNKEIRGIYVSFVEKNKAIYEKYKNNNEEMWRSKLLQVENYIENYDKLPSENDKDPVMKALGEWINNQRQSFINEKSTVYNNKDIRGTFVSFIEKNKALYKNEKNENNGNNQETWRSKLLQVENYIKDNDRLPSSSDKDPIIKALGVWSKQQQENLKNKRFLVYDNIEIKNIWISFIEECEANPHMKKKISRSKALLVEK